MEGNEYKNNLILLNITTVPYVSRPRYIKRLLFGSVLVTRKTCITTKAVNIISGQKVTYQY